MVRSWRIDIPLYLLMKIVAKLEYMAWIVVDQFMFARQNSKYNNINYSSNISGGISNRQLEECKWVEIVMNHMSWFDKGSNWCLRSCALLFIILDFNYNINYL